MKPAKSWTRTKSTPMTPYEVLRWFAGGTAEVVTTSQDRLDPNFQYVSENEFRWRRRRTVVQLTCRYDEGCPTCGGSYDMSWETWEELPPKQKVAPK